MLTIVKCTKLKSSTLAHCSFQIRTRKSTFKKLCGGMFGTLILLMFYFQKPYNGTDCPFWALCKLDEVGPDNQLSAVIILPPVHPDRCVQTASMYKGMIEAILQVNCSD